MASLASLVVNLQVETAELRKGLDQANAKLDEFGKHSETIANKLSTAFNIAAIKQVGQALAGFVTHGAAVADSMGKMAQRTGVSVEEFSRLAYAAELSDVSAEDLAVSMGKLGKQMADAFAGDKNAALKFKALGVSVTDASGHLRSTGDVMTDIAGKISRMADGAAKTAIMMELFGKSGAKLIPMMNEGTDGLKAMADEADRFGITLSGPAAAAADQFNDSIDKMKKVGEGVSLMFADAVTPALAKFSEQVLGAEGDTHALKDVFDDIAAALVEVIAGFRTAATWVSGFASAVANIGESWVVQQEGARLFREELERTKKANDELRDSLDKSKRAIQADLDLLAPLVGGAALDPDAVAKKLGAGSKGTGTKKPPAESSSYGSAFDASENTSAAAFDSTNDVYEKALQEHAQIVEESARAEQASYELMAQATADAAEGLKGMVASRTGSIGSLVQSGMQGAAVGGPIGAVVGVGLDLLTRSKSFQKLMESLDGIIQSLADGLGMILEPIGMLLEPLEPLGAIFAVWGKIMSVALAPGMALVSAGLKLVVTPLLYLARAIGWFWNGLVDLLSDMLRAMSKVPLLGFMKKWADQLEQQKVDTYAISVALDEMWNGKAEEIATAISPPGGESSGEIRPIAVAADDTSKSIDKMGDAADKATESLTNMISGYKINASRYDATVGDGRGGSAPTVNVFIDGEQTDPTRIEITNFVPVDPQLVAAY